MPEKTFDERYALEERKRLRWVSQLLGEPIEDCSLTDPVPVPEPHACVGPL